MYKKGMDELMKIFEPLAREFPLSMNIRYIHSGIPRWRISVFGLQMAKIGNSDAELLNVEDPDWQQALDTAVEKLKVRANDLRTKPFGLWNA